MTSRLQRSRAALLRLVIIAALSVGASAASAGPYALEITRASKRHPRGRC